MSLSVMLDLVLFFVCLIFGLAISMDTNFFAFGYAVGAYLFYVSLKFSTFCPKCEKFLCFKKIGSETLSRDVIQEIKYEKDGNGIERQKIYHYAVGERKHYYKCSKCGYKDTRIGKYKEQIK